VSNEELMKMSGMQPWSEMVKTRRMRLAGLSQTEDRPANVAINWVLEGGKKHTGRPHKTVHTIFTKDLENL